MKRLILVLIFFLLVASNAFAAPLFMFMSSSENDGVIPGEAGRLCPPITSDYMFTVETDLEGNITAFTDLFSNYFFAYSAGGYNPSDGEPFIEGEQIFPNGVEQTVSQVLFDGNTAGTTLWFKGQANPTGPFQGLVFDIGLLGITYDHNANIGIAMVGLGLELSEQYIFHQRTVPIPSAIWLLVSGLIGLVGFRRKLRKE